jgi:hypothetical protein
MITSSSRRSSRIGATRAIMATMTKKKITSSSSSSPCWRSWRYRLAFPPGRGRPLIAIHTINAQMPIAMPVTHTTEMLPNGIIPVRHRMTTRSGMKRAQVLPVKTPTIATTMNAASNILTNTSIPH